MVEEDIRKFAEVLVERAAEVAEGDNVYILAKSLEALPLFEEVRRQVIKKGGHPHEHLLYDSQIGSSMLDHDFMKHASDGQLDNFSEARFEELKRMDAYIRIGGEDNTSDLASIAPERVSRRQKATEEMLTERLKLNWVATRYPTAGMAQNAGMSTDGFRQLVLDAVTEVDWDALEEKNQRIKQVFDNAEEVRIESEGTDIRFSLRDREGVTSEGNRNLPDGEVFYAPVRHSVEGRIRFSYPGVESGNEVSGIELEFENGRIVECSAERNQDFLEKMIETDEGSHYLGEFGIGTNRQLTRYVKDTLFDEKIGGTVHFALGRAYELCVPDGEERNQSGIHWDLVKDLREQGDGGKIHVDGETVQENGEWVF